MKKDKITKISKSKVYADFFTGSAVAWFAGSVIPTVFKRSFDFIDLGVTASGLLETLIFIYLAIEYRKRELL